MMLYFILSLCRSEEELDAVEVTHNPPKERVDKVYKLYFYGVARLVLQSGWVIALHL